MLDADLLVLCCGTRPRTGLARTAGLATGAGVIVDDQLRSVTDPAVFAVGECAEHRGRTHGFVAPSWAQARVAAQVIAGEVAGRAPPAQDPPSYAGSPAVIRLKAAGIELATLGSVNAGRGAEVITFTDPARGVYQKLVVREGRLAGAILLGDTRTAGTLAQLFDRGAKARGQVVAAHRTPERARLRHGLAGRASRAGDHLPVQRGHQGRHLRRLAGRGQGRGRHCGPDPGHHRLRDLPERRGDRGLARRGSADLVREPVPRGATGPARHQARSANWSGGIWLAHRQ